MRFDEDSFRRLIRGQTRGVGAAIARFGLRLLSFGYGAGVLARNWAYDHRWKTIHHAGLPVVSIGNLTVGGTGKTPIVEYCARWFIQQGLRPAILSRGYRSTDDRGNDEALLLAENLPGVPHLQGADRVGLARRACQETESQVLILDDGFQHRRLHRDLDIVLIDATDPFGGRRLLPAGLLREPAAGLNRAHLAVITRADAVSSAQLVEIERALKTIALNLPQASVRFRPTALAPFGSRVQRGSTLEPPPINANEREYPPIEELSGKRILAFCGIGNPDGFFRTVTDLKAVVVDRRIFPDHHGYTRDDIDELGRWTQQHRPAMLLTTQKDLVKLRMAEIADVPVYALRIAAEPIAGRDSLHAALRRICS